ncbi:cell division protein FtsZ [Amylibacter kogurei]|uniref:Cell division protein FtsZ n=1 Tax=Paramylibacter kogurei TaxID=1889778 RepID=A0A2G5K3W5_9RHOB|nr:cell division protein FtsZ [Amylibacter kogurei]PIB24221.1 cell division protein FtsZ [Amylibacter kogurei]
MTLNLQIPEVADLRPKITVFGVGGAGCNAVNNMIEKNLEGVDFIVANTDAQALQGNKAGNRIQLGEKITEGLGAGARPSVGSAAAEESIETIVDNLAGSHMCFITAGMGGGTGTGAAPIIAQAARELGVLTVGVVTKPFQFEGNKRMRQAEEGVEALQKVVDTLIIIPNQNLFRIANEKTTFTEAFSLADDVLYQGVKGVTDLMVRPGLINLDFADIRVVMDEMGKAMMGTGEAAGEDRAIQAAEKAIANPLLDEISLNGAKGVLINITGGSDLTLFEVDEAANCIRNQVDSDANIIVGSTMDPTLDGMMRVSVVATGIDAAEGAAEIPVPRRTLKSPLPLANEAAAQEAETTSFIPEEEPAPAPAPQVAEQAPAQAEPELFDVQTPAAPAAPVEQPQQYAPAAQTFEPQVQETAAVADDQMPEPAYQPQYEEPAQELRFGVEQPRQQRAGEPSAETLARLEAAVAKQPSQQPLRADHAPAAMPHHHAEPKRGGVLGGFISRMTGAAEPAQATREQPSFTEEQQFSPEYDEMAHEDDQIEIPAFLRRQAN